MAIITKSNISGNWNDTASWDGGVVPTSVDDVIFNASSAGVILNVPSSIKSLDMTGFTGTFTQSANLTLLGSTNSTNQSYTVAPNFIVDGEYAWTAGSFIFINLGINQLNTSSRFFYNGSVSPMIKLYSTIYPMWGGGVGDGFASSIGAGGIARFTFGTHSVYWRGSAMNPASTNNNRIVTIARRHINEVLDNRDDHFIFDLDGAPFGLVEGEFRLMGVKLISGTISNIATAVSQVSVGDPRGFTFRNTNSNGLPQAGTCSFKIEGNGKIWNNTRLNGGYGPFTILIDSLNDMVLDLNGQKVDQVLCQSYFTSNGLPATNRGNRIRLNSPLICDWFVHYADPSGTALLPNEGRPVRNQILGPGGLSASRYSSRSLLNMVTSGFTGHPPVGNTSSIYFIQRAPNLEFTSDAVHKFDYFNPEPWLTTNPDVLTQMGSTVVRGTFSSITASVPATIEINKMAVMENWGLRDLNFTGQLVYDYDGSLLRTTGVTTSFLSPSPTPTTISSVYIK